MARNASDPNDWVTTEVDILRAYPDHVETTITVYNEYSAYPSGDTRNKRAINANIQLVLNGSEVGSPKSFFNILAPAHAGSNSITESYEINGLDLTPGNQVELCAEVDTALFAGGD